MALPIAEQPGNQCFFCSLQPQRKLSGQTADEPEEIDILLSFALDEVDLLAERVIGWASLREVWLDGGGGDNRLIPSL